MAKESILLVEDEKLIRWSLANRLSKEGYVVTEVDRGGDALKALEEREVDLILLDYRLPDMDGLAVLKAIGPKARELPVIMMTAYSTVESAIEAMKLGAFDYLNKPFEIEELLVTIQKALENTSLKRELSRYRKAQEERFGVSNLVGRNPRIVEVFELVKKIAASSATTILLQGESGTGKDFPSRCWNRSSSGTRRGPSPTPRAPRRAFSNWPTGGRSSSTRWRRSAPTSSPSSSGSSRSGASSGWAGPRTSTWTFGSSPPPAPTWSRP